MAVLCHSLANSMQHNMTRSGTLKPSAIIFALGSLATAVAAGHGAFRSAMSIQSIVSEALAPSLRKLPARAGVPPGSAPKRGSERNCILCPIRVGRFLTYVIFVKVFACAGPVHRGPVRLGLTARSLQFGPASAPMIPLPVQTMGGAKDGTGTSLGHGSTGSTA